MENYDEAHELAKESYQKYPWNAVTIQAYFEVLLNLPRTQANIAEYQSTIEAVDRLTGEKAEEVSVCMHGRYSFHIDADQPKALTILDEGIAKFDRSPYPILAKMEIGIVTRDKALIDEALAQLGQRGHSEGGPGKVQVIKGEIMSVALGGEKGKALARIDRDLGFIFEPARERFRQRVIDA